MIRFGGIVVRIRQSNTRYEIFFTFAILFLPEIFTQIKPIFFAFSGIAIVIFFIYGSKLNNRWPTSLIMWGTIRGFLLLSMVLNKNIADIDKWAKDFIYIADLIVVIHYYVKKEKNKELLSVISTLGIVYFSLNVITMLVFPSGILSNIGGNYYFLGTRNHFLKYIFAFVTASGLQKIYYQKSFPLYVIVVLSVLHILIFKVATGIMCAIIIVVMLICRKIIKHIINVKTIVISTLILSVAFVFFDAASWFIWIIETVLNKDVGLNSRNVIWEQAIAVIFNDPLKLLLGHGITNSGNFVHVYQIYLPAHNQLLQWLFEYGIIGTSLLYMFFIKMDRKGLPSVDRLFVYILIFSCLVGGIVSDPLDGASGYFVICILPYLSSFNANQKQLA